MGKEDFESLDTQLRIPDSELRWKCPDSWLPFDNTANIEPVRGVVGQEDAIESLRFGLEIDAEGQNIYVRGLTGTGRTTLVEHLLKEIKPHCPPADDLCYVHNFAQPYSPRLLSLPRGNGGKFKHQLDSFVSYIDEQLAPSLSSDAIRARRRAIDDLAQQSIRELGKPFEEELRSNNLSLIPMQVGTQMQPAILPLIDGKPVALDKLEELAAQGAFSHDQVEAIHRKIFDYAGRFEDLSQKINEIQFRHHQSVTDLFETEARRILKFQLDPTLRDFPSPAVQQFVNDITEDLVKHRLQLLGKDTNFSRLYRVNALLTHEENEPCPVIRETTPSLRNLLGNIDREISAGGAFKSDHLMIRAGSLLRANGGHLVLEVSDVLNEPGAWKVLLRTIKNGKLEIVPSELTAFSSGPLLKPEPIPLRIKVILIGDPGVYQMLDRHDPDFSYLFKVLADFETSIARDETGARYYAGVLARLAEEEGLTPFDRSAVMAIAEHGARIVGEKNRLTTRFGRLADIAREASYLARTNSAAVVTSQDIFEAIGRGRRRGDLPARRFRKLITDRTIRIETNGQQVGQINGLGVIQAGPLTYGFPTRITASIGPGTSGAVNIEREAELSGSIHTKGFYILGGLLRNLLRTSHPLAFSASIAFEQSYGGIDGDSASGAEMVCLLSALTNVPLRQDLAMTGAIDQLGHIQPIGAVSEKVEGFFSVCNDIGCTGTQGVVIPRANAGDLMLDAELLKICEQGKFHVYAVDTIQQALELFTGRTVGVQDKDGKYPDGSLLNLAMRKAYDYWKMATTPEKQLRTSANNNSSNIASS